MECVETGEDVQAGGEPNGSLPIQVRNHGNRAGLFTELLDWKMTSNVCKLR